MKKKINKLKLQALQLNATERLQLSLFVANNRDWVARYAVPLETVLRQSLRCRWIELLRIQKVEPHPVYELAVRLGRSSPATKTGIEMAVRQAFAAAGRSEWEGLRSVGVVEGQRWINGVVTVQRRYYLTSLPAAPTRHTKTKYRFIAVLVATRSTPRSRSPR